MDTTDDETETTAPEAEAKNPSMPAGFDTVENWARAKGMLPEFREVENPRNPKRLRPRAKPLLIHNPSFAPYSAAKAVNHWPTGMEMSEADFDKAIADQTAHVYH